MISKNKCHRPTQLFKIWHQDGAATIPKSSPFSSLLELLTIMKSKLKIPLKIVKCAILAKFVNQFVIFMNFRPSKLFKFRVWPISNVDKFNFNQFL